LSRPFARQVTGSSAVCSSSFAHLTGNFVSLGKVLHKRCYFHFYKAILDHVSEEKLKANFDSIPAFNMFLRMFPTLALIDPQHIGISFNNLKERSVEFRGVGYERVNNFVKYFEKVHNFAWGFCNSSNYRLMSLSLFFRRGSAEWTPMEPRHRPSFPAPSGTITKRR